MATIYALGPFRLDVAAGILFCGTEPVALGQRAVALLRVLVAGAGNPISKDRLIESAWPGLAIEESNLAVQIAALRRVFAEEPGGDSWIKTSPRRGYRYVGPVVVKEQENQGAADNEQPALAPPDKPSLAVMPFTNMSGDPEQEYFADGMVEEIITGLSRIKRKRRGAAGHIGRPIDERRFRPSINWPETRTRPPALRTLPSST
jgi:DNA-binding winged helix-turn-helix (wHTH) protein